MKRRFYIPAVLLLIATSCTQKRTEKSRTEYMQWMQTHADVLTRIQEKDGKKFELRYQPAEYLALRETGIKESAFGEMLKTANESMAFALRISYPDPSGNPLAGPNQNAPGYPAALSYVMNGAQADFSLICRSDTLPCRYYQYEPNYGAAPYTTLLLEFDNPFREKPEQPDADVTVRFEDHLHGSGILNFIFTKKELRTIPLTH
jgi:hypothetical protein